MTAVVHTDSFNRIIDTTKSFISKSKFERRAFAKYLKLEIEKLDDGYGKLTAVACDGCRLSIEHCMLTECDESFVAYIKPNIHLPKDQLIIKGEGYSFGFTQPKNPEEFDHNKPIPKKEDRVLRIGFNGQYLLEALQAAKRSAGFDNPVVLEFYGEVRPAIIRTHKEDIKMVLPVRLKSEEE